MRWLLIIYVMTGEHHGIQTVEFELQRSCIEAAEYIYQTADSVYRNKTYVPVPKCVKL